MAGIVVFLLQFSMTHTQAREGQVKAANADLPKVEKDFCTIDNQLKLNDDDSKTTFKAIVPPKSIKRVILLRDHGNGTLGGRSIDLDVFFNQFVMSTATCDGWGLDALERPVADLLIVCKKDKIYRLTVLTQQLGQGQGVTGVLLYGKGFSCRFDFRTSPLRSEASD